MTEGVLSSVEEFCYQIEEFGFVDGFGDKSVASCFLCFLFVFFGSEG